MFCRAAATKKGRVPNGTAELWQLEVGAQREDARVRGVSKRVIDIELQERIDELSLVVRAAWPIVCPR